MNMKTLSGEVEFQPPGNNEYIGGEIEVAHIRYFKKIWK